jgi:DNA processing protein
MTTRSDNALASLLLTNRLVDVGVSPLSSRDYWRLVAQTGDPAGLLGIAADALVRDLGIGRELAERAVRLLAAGTVLAVELEHLEQQGLQVLSPFDQAYPQRLTSRLGTAAPPILYTAGPPALLAGPAVAVVGSRDIGDEGAGVARRAARLLAGHGRTLVSGGAKGVDQLAMDAAAEAGGPVVGVLADSLTRRLRDPDLRRAIGREEVCLVTPYKPTAGFSVASAMSRNKIIYALAEVTLVVAADAERGGTWEGAAEALRRRFGPVAVWTGPGAGDGNALLADRGARAIDDLELLLDVPTAAPGPVTQLRLSV